MTDPQAPVDASPTGATASTQQPEPGPVIWIDRDPQAEVAPAPDRRRPLPLLLASVVAVVLLLGAGTYAVYRFANGDGRRVEEFTPASVAAFAAVDLDTGLEQQLKLLRLAQRAPQNTGGDAEQRDRALGKLLEGLGLAGVDIDRDVLSWLGHRVGVALWLDGDQSYALIAATSTDTGKASSGLARVRDAVKDSDLGFVARDGVVLIALGEKGAQPAAERAFAEAQRTPLAGAAEFSADRGWLKGDQLAVVWVDLPRYGKAATMLAAGARPVRRQVAAPMLADELTKAERAEAEPTPEVEQHGRFIAGIRATEHGLEARYRTFGTQSPAPAIRDAATKLGALPGDTHVGAVAQLPRDLAEQAGMPTSPYGSMLGMAMMGLLSSPDDDLAEQVDVDPPAEPDLTKAEQEELSRLMAKGLDELTEAERKRAEQLMDMPPGALTTLGSGGDPMNPGALGDPFTALGGATVSVAARTGQGQRPAIRVVAEALDATRAQRIATFLRRAGSDLTATVEGGVVTATSEGYAPGTGTLADRESFQRAVADAPASTNLAIYLDLAGLLPPAERDRLPFQTLAVLQGADGGDQTGIVRLIMR